MQAKIGSCAVIAVALAAAFASVEGSASGSPPPDAPSPSPAAPCRLRATGKGRAPTRANSDAQLRLMARRAAVVDAYRNAARALGHARSTAAGGTGVETVRGFIRGVELIETRYYRGGDVEVDVEFTVPAAPAAPAATAAPAPGDLLLVEKGKGPMSEEEWREILGGAGAQVP